MRPANERRRDIVTSSLIGWIHTQNDPWVNSAGVTSPDIYQDTKKKMKFLKFSTSDKSKNKWYSMMSHSSLVSLNCTWGLEKPLPNCWFSWYSQKLQSILPFLWLPFTTHFSEIAFLKTSSALLASSSDSNLISMYLYKTYNNENDFTNHIIPANIWQATVLWTHWSWDTW